MTAQATLDINDVVASIHGSWGGKTHLQQAATFAEEGRGLLRSMITYAEGHYQALQTEILAEDSRVEHLCYTFEWPEGAKEFGLLWRAILIELEHLAVLECEGAAVDDAVDRLAAAGKARLEAQVRGWFKATEERLSELRRSPEHLAKALYEWGLQTNPWPVYEDQLQQLALQFERLSRDCGVRVASAATLAELATSLKATPAAYIRDLEGIREACDAAIEVIREAEDGEPAKVSTTRIQALEVAEYGGSRVDALTRASNAIIDKLPERAQLFVVMPDGQLRYRDVNLERDTSQWISAEVMPELQRAGQVVDQTVADFDRTLVDVRNRVGLVKDLDDPELEFADGVPTTTLTALQAPLDNFQDRLERARAEVEGYTRIAIRKIDEELRFSRAYNPERGFLEVSFEAGISQVRRRQDAVFSRFSTWLGERRKALGRLTSRVAEEESLSVGEKVVRVIRARRTDPANAAYTSVLVTRGFIGEAFHAGRHREILRTQQAVAAWRDGLRGAVAVTGSRYCGKTHFAELIAGRFFEQKIVRVQPYSKLEINGRRLATTCDLAEALGFVRKHSIGSRIMVLIDDLEAWSSVDHGVAENAEALRDTIDQLSARIFFVVGMGNWTFAHLAAGLAFARAFQVEINLDAMDLPDFVDTVITRHAATHMRVLDAEDREVSEGALRDHAEDVHRAARGNVGDGLRRWAQSMRFVDATTVRLRPVAGYALPNFIDGDTGLVLTAVKRERTTNEYRLRKQFGPAFDSDYRPIVRRLSRLDLLVRQRSGALAINPTVNNEIGRLLERDGYLHASYSGVPIGL